MNIGVINNKGGTGKTTTSVNVSAALASRGYRVLLVDLDAQASASLSLGVKYSDLTPSAADVLFSKYPIESAIRNSSTRGLDLLTGAMDLANGDLYLANIAGRENILADCLSTIEDRYNFIIFDCPPSLSLVSINALMAAKCFMVTVTAEYLALEGLISLMTAVEKINKGMDMGPKLLGIVFTMVNRQLKSSKKIIGLVEKRYGNDVFLTEINKNVSLSEAPSYGVDIYTYAPKSRGACDYMMLADEVIERCNALNEGGHAYV